MVCKVKNVATWSGLEERRLIQGIPDYEVQIELIVLLKARSNSQIS